MNKKSASKDSTGRINRMKKTKSEKNRNSRIKVFLFTLAAVVLVGSAAIIFWSKTSADAAYFNKSVAAEIAEMKKEEEERLKNEVPAHTETIIINALPSPFDNENEEALAEENTEEIVAEPEEIDYEAMYAGAKNTKVISTLEEGKVTISFAGDVLFDPGYSIYSAFKQRGCDVSQSFSADLLYKMRTADIMMLNNEFPYSYGGAPQENKMYTFRADPSSVSTLDDLGVDIVSLANNHTFDYGEQAFLDTLATLENADMPYVGAGRNLEDASSPYYFIVDGKKIAIIGASQIEKTWNPDTRGATDSLSGVFRCLDAANLCATLQKAKSECDFVILYVHWGTESTDRLDAQQVSEVTKYVDAGADLIIGDHPHVLQEVGYVKGVPVIYSLGNYWFNSKTQDSCIVTLTLNTEDATIESLRFEPCMQINMSAVLLHDGEKERVLNYMRSISGTANIDDEGYITAR